MKHASWAAGLVFGLGVAYVASTLLTPLYPIYGQAFGFSDLAITEIYAVYVVGNLCALLLLGRLSHQLGRKPTSRLRFASA